MSELAEKIVKELQGQKCGDEELLHAAVCCDYGGERSLVRLIDSVITRHPSPEVEAMATALEEIYRNGQKQGWVQSYEISMGKAKQALADFKQSKE